jgi:hypothetical protein
MNDNTSFDTTFEMFAICGHEPGDTRSRSARPRRTRRAPRTWPRSCARPASCRSAAAPCRARGR